MEIEPQEGVDYLIDLYAVAGVERDAPTPDAVSTLNQRILEYHPDRLEGLAPEFQEKGQRMAVLLNRARAIFQSPAARAEYDELLNNWDGPISETGNPVITPEWKELASLRAKTPAEIEEHFLEQADQIEILSGYSPSRLELLEELIESSGGQLSDRLRVEYEAALAQKSNILAVEEAERSKLLGLPEIEEKGYAVGTGYVAQLEETIDDTRGNQLEGLRMQALGGLTTKFALLSHQPLDMSTIATPDELDRIRLPDYFEPQAQKILEIAAEREEITKKRLENVQLEFPESDLQQDFKPRVMIGLKIGEDFTQWFETVYKYERPEGDQESTTQKAQDKDAAFLEAGDYKSIIDQDCGVVIVEHLAQVEITDMLLAAIDKYLQRYITQDEQPDSLNKD